MFRAASHAGLAVFGVVCLSCGGSSPSEPSPTGAAARSPGLSTEGTASALHEPNLPPNIILRTTPPALPGEPFPVIRGMAPFTVEFNLCQSTDPNQDPDQTTGGEGDSLNWQFHFGDDGTEPFDHDGTFNPRFEHFCRVEHTYESAGRYTATLSVTDKHLFDQSRAVSAQARVTERLSIAVYPAVVEDTSPDCDPIEFPPLPASTVTATGELLMNNVAYSSKTIPIAVYNAFVIGNSYDPSVVGGTHSAIIRAADAGSNTVEELSYEFACENPIDPAAGRFFPLP